MSEVQENHTSQSETSTVWQVGGRLVTAAVVL